MQIDLIEKRPVATGYPTTDVGSPFYRRERAGLAEASLHGTLAITLRAIVRNAKREDVFFFLLPAAFPIFVSSLYGFFAMSLLIPFFFYRISIEERMLIEEYGDKYWTYCETTRKLIPFIF